MNETKQWYQSTGVWGGLIAVGSAAAGAFGWSIAPQDQAAAIGHVTGIVSGIGGILAIWGRMRASAKIG